MTTLPALNQRSKLLFNSAHMLRVSAEIGRGKGDFDCAGLQTKLGLGQSSVQRILRSLEGVGLIVRTPRGSQTVPIVFKRVPHSFWVAAEDLLDMQGGS